MAHRVFPLLATARRAVGWLPQQRAAANLCVRPSINSVRHKWTPTTLPGTVAAAMQPLDPAADRLQAITFVQARSGQATATAAAVVDALAKPEWGASGAGGLLALATRLAGRWEVGEDAGLASLVAAVERDLATRAGRELVRFTVLPARGQPFACEGLDAMSLKDVAEFGDGVGAETLGELLECACSGVMACSTCHVHVDPQWLDAVGPPSEEEEDMLDLAFDRRVTSRLGCQLQLRPELDGLRISLPAGANNLFDHIPFDGDATGRPS